MLPSPSFRDDVARGASDSSNATTLIQPDDLISRLKEGLAMAGNDNHSACLTAGDQRLDEFGFRVDVESGGGLIHEDDRVFTKERAG